MAVETVKRGGGFKRVMGILLLLVIVIGALWTWFSLSWAYSDGNRAGIEGDINHHFPFL